MLNAPARLATSFLVLILLLLPAARAGGQAPGRKVAWRVVADLPLPGRAARFDYQSLDATTGWLWIAHMGAGEVVAVDVRSRRVVARVAGMPGATGVLAVPSLARVFVALSGSHMVAVLDAGTGRLLRRMPGGRFPDGLAYAAAAHKLFVSDEYGRQELVLDLASLTPRPPIPMGGEVGNTQYDSAAGLIWAAVQSRNEVVALDPVADSIVGRVAVAGVDRPHGLLLDSAHRLAYVAGEGNARLGVLDLRTRRLVGTYSVPEEPDVLALDPERHLLYVAAESGAVAAFDIRGDSLVSLPAYRTPHAHSVAVDPATHLVYLPLEDVGGGPVLRVLMLEER